MVNNLKETNKLKEKLGSEITLIDENEKEHVFHLVLELITDDKHYAFLQSPDDEEGDIEVLRVVQDSKGEIDLEFIEDDDEWDNAAELFDEWTYSVD